MADLIFLLISIIKKWEISKLPSNYADIYNNAVSQGKDGTAALNAAMTPYNQNVSAAKATIADLPASIQSTFQSDLANKKDPSVAAQDAHWLCQGWPLDGPDGNARNRGAIRRFKGA